MNRVFLKIIFYLLLLSIIFVTILLIQKITLSCNAISDIDVVKEQISVCENEEKFHELQAINKEIVAWIKIENTNIDLPIMQTVDNAYYLTHTFDQKNNSVGSIFLDYRNNSDFTDKNTILYGHTRYDGSMFTELKKYQAQAFYEENSIIVIQTERCDYYYQVVSVNIVKEYETYRSINYYTEFTEYIAGMQETSLIKSEVIVSPQSRILTLSTCSDKIKDGRLIVIAVLLDEGG